MSNSYRLISRYNAFNDQLARHPNWTVKVTELHGLGEVFDLPMRLALVDPAQRGPHYAVAHVLAHLDLGHVNPRSGGRFTAEQEADAHWLACLRLDEEAHGAEDECA